MDIVQLEHGPPTEAPVVPEAVLVGEVAADSAVQLKHAPLRSNAARYGALVEGNQESTEQGTA